MQNEIDRFMTIHEAATRWNVKLVNIKTRIHTLQANKVTLKFYTERGFIKKSYKTWILSTDLMTIWYGEEVKQHAEQYNDI